MICGKDKSSWLSNHIKLESLRKKLYELRSEIKVKQKDTKLRKVMINAPVINKERKEREKFKTSKLMLKAIVQQNKS